jgi:hypothetical protein
MEAPSQIESSMDEENEVLCPDPEPEEIQRERISTSAMRKNWLILRDGLHERGEMLFIIEVIDSYFSRLILSEKRKQSLTSNYVNTVSINEGRPTQSEPVGVLIEDKSRNT